MTVPIGTKLLLFVAAVLLLCGCGAGNQPQQDDGSEEDTDSVAVTALGWNLGNSLDAYANGVANDTAFSNPPATQAMFDSVYAAGIRCVRIPVTWLGHVGPAPDYKIDQAWLGHVAEVVGMAKKAGMQRCVINIHHDGADGQHWLKVKEASTDSVLDASIRSQLSAMWTQIASTFRGEGTWLVFECLNEIHDGGWGWGGNRSDNGLQYATLNGWMQTCVNAIRQAEDPANRHWVAVTGYVTNPDLTIAHLTLPLDSANRLMVDVHSYDPFDFALQATKTEWGHTGDSTRMAPGSAEADWTNMLRKLHDAYVAKGIPCYVGEMCATRRDNPRDEAFREYWMRYTVRACREYGLQPYIWDNGYPGTGTEQSGLFDRTTGAFLNPDARRTVQQMVETFKPEVTLQDIYNTAPTF